MPETLRRKQQHLGTTDDLEPRFELERLTSSRDRMRPACPASYRPTDWIEKLNQAVANKIDQVYWAREKRKWPVDLMGGLPLCPGIALRGHKMRSLLGAASWPENSAPVLFLERCNIQCQAQFICEIHYVGLG